jgi:Leucine-rich repeat (LRR) protein
MEDIIYHILTFLQISDIFKCSTVNKLFHKICTSQMLWKNFKQNIINTNNYYKDYKVYHSIVMLNTIIKHQYIKQLHTVTTLDAYYLQLSTFPIGLCHLSNLQILHLHRNKLSHIPKEISQLTNLHNLALSFNNFKTFPSNICLLNNLKVVYLNNNQLATIPTQIGHLTNLHYLSLNDNQLTTIPSEIGNLNKLQELCLSNNPLISLPPNLNQLDITCYISINQEHNYMLPNKFTI